MMGRDAGARVKGRLGGWLRGARVGRASGHEFFLGFSDDVEQKQKKSGVRESEFGEGAIFVNIFCVCVGVFVPLG